MFFSKARRRERRHARMLIETGFDQEFYLSQVDRRSLNGLDPVLHYLRSGWRNGLDPADWFSTSNYLALYPDVRAADCDPLLHFIEYGRNEGRSSGKFETPELDRPHVQAISTPSSPKSFEHQDAANDETPLSIITRNFDLVFYSSQLGSAQMSMAQAVHHYMEKGCRLGLDPHPQFSTADYLLFNPDVAQAGVNPYFHFLTRAGDENRPSSASGFLVRDGLANGQSEWSHYAHVGRRAKAAQLPGEPDLDLLDFTVTLAGLDLAAEVLAHRLERRNRTKKPEVSVVIPCWNEATVTAECLLSVFKCADEAELEVVLVNDGSTDPFFAAIAAHPDIIQIDSPQNMGFGPSVNLGVKNASGEFVLLLNNDTQIAPGTISALSKALKKEKTVGAISPRIISFDGRLQEAGAIINADGTGQLIGFAESPSEPRFSYSRDVEHLSAACLIMRRKDFLGLDGFDPIFAPAYCEDADLSLRLRSKGFRLRYLADGLVAHHLSKTTSSKASENANFSRQKLVSRNRNSLVKRWAAELGRFDIRTIAFYLPQYHPIPENDLWWGKGFTEWTNLVKTKPNFTGHRQPRQPADLGYYDLRVPDVMDQQAALARNYGLSGFCYYYYRFGDKRMLEAPLERMLETGRPDFPFCLCWANENWSRKWDGMDDDLLLEQKYGEDDAIGFAKDVARYFKSSNYITVEGKPLILFYRLQEIPHSRRYLGICRNVWKSAGFPDVMVAMVESFELSADPKDPASFGADITVEFPAHGMVHDPAQHVNRINPDWIGAAHDYRELCNAFMKRTEAGFKRIRSVLVGWDTTPRHADRSLVLRNSTPGAFQAWLEWTYQRTREQNYGDERLVFINAWNEWCEGSYLEPDTEFGHAYLQAVKNAQDSTTTRGKSFVEVR